MNFKASGASGVLQVGGRPAALLREWTFVPTGDRWTVTAGVVERDEHWLSSGYPLDLRLDLRQDTWRFRQVEATVTDTTATITGTTPPEEISHAA